MVVLTLIPTTIKLHTHPQNHFHLYTATPQQHARHWYKLHMISLPPDLRHHLPTTAQMVMVTATQLTPLYPQPSLLSLHHPFQLTQVLLSPQLKIRRSCAMRMITGLNTGIPMVR